MRVQSRKKKGASGIPPQQLALITRFGLAHEGEQTGEEALRAYVELFAKPLSSTQIAAVLALYGWEPEALPLAEHTPGTADEH